MKITPEIRWISRSALAAALLLAAAPAAGEVYSWRDPETGRSRLSNIAPPWYSRREAVDGPRVVATVGNRVVDDTGLPYADRLQLRGRPKEAVANPPAQARPLPAAPGAREPARTPRGRRADAAATRDAEARSETGS